jgi:hypothetical protein
MPCLKDVAFPPDHDIRHEGNCKDGALGDGFTAKERPPGLSKSPFAAM